MSTIADAQVEAAQTSLGHEGVYVGAPTVRRALEAATTPDFGAWATKWHSTVGTMCVMLGINGNGSPEEILAELQAYLSALAPQAGDNAEEPVAARDVLAERRRQIEVEGWTPAHDDAHRGGEMAIAAACYALNAADDSDGPETRFVGAELWPWADEWWKPATPRSDLVKAAALIIAEIDRLDRAALASHPCTSTPVVSQNAPVLEGNGGEVHRLRRMVERRDEFIIASGLWDAFKEARRDED